MSYSQLQIYLQPIDDFGVEQGEPQLALNDAIVHAQVGETIKDPIVTLEEGIKSLTGTWTIREREWSELDSKPEFLRTLTLFLYQR